VEQREVVFRSEAADDLSAIYLWVHEASGDPGTAQHFVGRIVAFCEKIGGMAHAGRPRDDLLPGLRSFPFEKRTVIMYRVAGKTVEITNVFHGGRDYEALYRREDGEPAP
jgi:toxin ParE1/3/4